MLNFSWADSGHKTRHKSSERVSHNEKCRAGRTCCWCVCRKQAIYLLYKQPSQHDCRPCSHSFSKTCWSASFWKYRKWVGGKQCAKGKGKQCGKTTLSGPASQDYGEQIPDGMSQLTMDNSTVDTELTINVRNLVAKIRKSKIIELL